MKTTIENGRRTRLLALALLAAVASIGLGGCNNKPKQQDLMIADLTKENDDLRAQAQSAQDSLTQAQTRVTELENENATLKQAVAATPTQAPAPSGGGGGGGSDRILTIAGDVAFNAGSATLTAAGRREVDKVISEIKSKWGGHRVEIAGFTDPTPLRKTKDKWTDNENLSVQRALAVERYMNSKGISDDVTHVAGYGSARPKGSHKESRRVEIKILAN